MTSQAPINTLLSIGGRNLTGMGMLLSIDENELAKKTEEIDLIGESWVYEQDTGKRNYGFSISGYVRSDIGSVLKLHGAPNGSVIYSRYGNRPGADAFLIREVLTKNGTFDLPREGLMKVTGIQYELSRNQKILTGGTLLSRQLVIGDGDAPYTNQRVDFGSPHTTGWTAIIHVDTVEWDGATRLDVDLYTSASADGSSGWSRVSDPGTRRFVPANGNYQDSHQGSNVNLARWVGVGTSWTGGTAPQANIIVALKRT